MKSLFKYVHVVFIVALLTSAARADETQPQAHPLKHATKDSPWTNSVGLEFIPVPGKTGVFVCRTETRVRDFVAFVDDTGHDATGKAWTLETGGWKQTDGTWKNPHFPKGAAQTPDHPVVCVNWEDAQAFCKWLSGKEKGVTYRLPTDAEWSAALGSTGNYPWGDQFPPPDHAGNYAGSEANIGAFASKNFKTIKGFSDGAARTARVGSYAPNPFGFYDLSGNVIEWCEDRYRHETNDPDAVRILKAFGSNDGTHRVLRGGSWSNQSELLLRTSNREKDEPTTRGANCGFRCVVVLDVSATAQSADEPTSVNKEPTERTVELQEITALQEMTALSSMQCYTYFALVRNMLEGRWDDSLFKQCYLYDGMNLQMMQRHEEKLEGDRKWGPFLKSKNALHKKVHGDLEPLIRQKRERQNLTTTDLEKLQALDKLILEKLIKAAQDPAVPDLSKGMPNATLEKKENVNGRETFHLKTALSSKEFSGTLRRFLGAGWSNRILKKEEMILAGNKARTLNAIVNLSVYENAKLPRVEIRVIHFKYKGERAGSEVEIVVIRQEMKEINTDNDFSIRDRDILDSVDGIAARRLGSGW